MNRRTFLQGTLVSVAAAASTALVRLASPDETATLAVGQPAILGQPSAHWLPYDWTGEVFMLNRRGEFSPIGYVTRLEIKSSLNELMSWDGDVIVVPGLKRAEMSFEGKSQ